MVSGAIPLFVSSVSTVIRGIRPLHQHQSRRWLCSMTRLPPLVTWDVDGTLLHATGPKGNFAHKRAIEEAVRLAYGVTASVNEVAHAGCTDRAIIRDMCELRDVPRDTIAAKMDQAIRHADELIEVFVKEGGGMDSLVLPGVRDILDAIRGSGGGLMLATGNLESCAWAKIKAAGLDGYFGGGGFGSDFVERTDIVSKAIEQGGGKDGGRMVFHVGDAVADMRAAKENGVGGIGVLTGSFSREELEREGALVVLDDLSDVKGFLRLVGVEGVNK